MAETIILIRRSGISGSIPTSGSLQIGELALNTVDGGLFYHDTGSDSVELIRAGTASFALNAATGGAGDVTTILSATIAFGTAVRKDSTLTTGVMPSGSIESGSFNLGRTFILHRVSASAETRVRLYSSASFMNADTTRSIGVDPTGEHGVILDAVLSGSPNFFSLDLAPYVIGADAKPTPDGDIAYSVTDLGGTAESRSIVFTHLEFEASVTGTILDRNIVTNTTATLTSGSEETGSINLGKVFNLLNVSTSVDSRIRLYTTPAFRDADLSRGVGTDPTGEHGVIIDLVLTGSFHDWQLSPIPIGASLESPPSATIAYAIQNRTAASIAVPVDFTRVVIENWPIHTATQSVAGASDSASFATTASWAATASFVETSSFAISASWAETASFATTASWAETGSFAQRGIGEFSGTFSGTIEPLTTTLQIYDGASLETTDVSVISDGATVSCSLEQKGGGDLQFFFWGNLYTLDTTPIGLVELAPGTDTSPLQNFVYVTSSLAGSLSLEADSSGFPLGPFAPIATILVQSVASTQADGPYKVHVWTDHLFIDGEDGHLSHINKKLRALPADWVSGAGSSYSSSVSESWASTEAGIIFQLHDHTMPAIDTATGEPLYLFNDPTTAYKRINGFSGITQDADGTALQNNRYYNFVLWGVVSEDDSDCKLMLNLPIGNYALESEAQTDGAATALYTMPTVFRGTSFLISRYTLQYKSSGIPWLLSVNTDLRGLSPSTSPGGGGIITVHGALTGLVDDDHVQYLLADGSRALSSSWNATQSITSSFAGDLTGSVTGTFTGSALIESGSLTFTDGTNLWAISAISESADLQLFTPSATWLTVSQSGHAVFGNNIVAIGHGAMGADSAINDASLLQPGWAYSSILNLQEELVELDLWDYMSGLLVHTKINPTGEFAWVTNIDSQTATVANNTIDLSFTDIWGIFNTVIHNSHEDLDELIGEESYIVNVGSGSIWKSTGVKATVVNFGIGHMDIANALTANFWNFTTGSVDEVKVINVEITNTTGSIGTLTGLYIEDANVADVGRAIYTNLGLVSFGDLVEIRNGGFVTTGSGVFTGPVTASGVVALSGNAELRANIVSGNPTFTLKDDYAGGTLAVIIDSFGDAVGRVSIYNAGGTAAIQLTANQPSYFNIEKGAVADLGVHGDSIDDLFFANVETDRVGIATNDPDALFEVAGTLRSTSNTGLPISGSGLEMFFQPSPELGIISARDREGSAYWPMQYGASSHTFIGGNVTVTGSVLVTGDIHLDNNQHLITRNTADTADIQLIGTNGAANTLLLGSSGVGGSISFNDGNGVKMYYANGKLRIGDGAIPSAALEVVGALTVTGSVGSIEIDDTGVRQLFTRGTTSYIDCNTAGGQLAFIVNGNADATASLFLKADGKVGINTTTPFGFLSVTGFSAAANDVGTFQVTDGTGANTDTKLTMGVVDNLYGWIQAVKPGTDIKNLCLQPNSKNVLIGTVTDSGDDEKLQISGGGILISASDQTTARMHILNTTGGHKYALIGGELNIGQTGFDIADITDNVSRLTIADTTGLVTVGPLSSSTLNVGALTAQSGSVLGSNLADQHQVTGSLDVTGSFSATDKSFVIPHPEDRSKHLRYGSLEGPEHGIFVRGRVSGSVINLPSYWSKLARVDSITVQLTPIGTHQDLYVEKVDNNIVYIKRKGLFKKGIDAFYLVQAERADIDKLKTVY